MKKVILVCGFVLATATAGFAACPPGSVLTPKGVCLQPLVGVPFCPSGTTLITGVGQLGAKTYKCVNVVPLAPIVVNRATR